MSNINYEANTTFSVVIRCVDSGNPQLYRDEPFVITVLDVNEIPTGLVMEGGAVKENSLPQTVATFYTSDPDNEFFQRQARRLSSYLRPFRDRFVLTELYVYPDSHTERFSFRNRWQ